MSVARKIYHLLPLPIPAKRKIKEILRAVLRYSEPSHDAAVARGLPSSSTEAAAPGSRREKLLARIDPTSQDGLEIGPLASPLVTKLESHGRIAYVDYATAHELREVYRNEPSVKLDEIVETDYIWGDKRLSELVGQACLDYAIASHVIEHVPDMIGWLYEIAQVLKDGGILGLAVPDKRYSFDYFRELSTPGMLIEAYLTHRRRPGIQSIFDYFALTGHVDVEAAWEGSVDKHKFRPSGSLEQAFGLAHDALGNNHYHDAHVNVFTPASFLDLLEVAARLQLLDFAVVEFTDTTRNTLEFLVSLQRVSRGWDRQKIMAHQLAGLAQAREHLG
jgi:SAM-dependent methyltransferase